MKFERNWPRGIGGLAVKIFSFFSSDGHLVNRSGTILSILVEGNLSNIPMKFQ